MSASSCAATMLANIAHGLLGLAVCVGLLTLLSENRSAWPARTVFVGLLLQCLFAIALLRLPGFAYVFELLARFLNEVIKKADVGIAFLFGEKLASPSGPVGFVFAIRVLPVIVFFSALTSLLYYFGVMQRIVGGIAWILRKTFRVSAVEAVVLSANVFVGQTEAPLCVSPYLRFFTRSQFAVLMISGFATMSGSVIATYVAFLGGSDDAQRVFFLKHLLTASLMSAPAALVAARILVPDTTTLAQQEEGIRIHYEKPLNAFAALADGAWMGLKLAANIAAMLIAFLGTLAILDWPVGVIAGLIGYNTQLGLTDVAGWMLAPVAWCLGVPATDAVTAGGLIAKQILVNEFVAYKSMGDIISGSVPGELSPRAAVIVTYALCGFSNLSSVAMQVGALSMLVPEQRHVILSLGLRCVFAGAISCWMTAATVGMLT
ncbi:MAG: NupC/NupG family nucleoside CNT transporter [Thermomicrobiales bacterium]|jgi:CNT family concentrative nucleoside transporter|nr:MAG: NupC/NupG family nucleoside CNT transporter [Thermomicrobiales bacterium]